MFFNNYNGGNFLGYHRSLRPRHFAVILLFLYVLLEAIVLATCTTTTTKSYYLTRLQYAAEVESGNSIVALDLRLGYFSSCLYTTSVSGLKSSWSCGIDAYQQLISDSNFDQSNQVDVALYNLVLDTADIFRRRCLTPYILLTSVILSFVVLTLMASVSPLIHRHAYKFVFLLSYVSLALSVVASVWQETNIKTANMLMLEVMNDYFVLSTNYGSYTRAAVWTGTGIQIIISACTLFIAVASSFTDRFTSWWDYRRPVL